MITREEWEQHFFVVLDGELVADGGATWTAGSVANADRLCRTDAAKPLRLSSHQHGVGSVPAVVRTTKRAMHIQVSL